MLKANVGAVWIQEEMGGGKDRRKQKGGEPAARFAARQSRLYLDSWEAVDEYTVLNLGKIPV